MGGAQAQEWGQVSGRLVEMLPLRAESSLRGQPVHGSPSAWKGLTKLQNPLTKLPQLLPSF